MCARWLLAVAACSGLAWAGLVHGACNQELLQKGRSYLFGEG
jgi:hypothetical protein